MERILILDDDHPPRAKLIDELRRVSNADAVIAGSGAELILHVRYGGYAAVFVDATCWLKTSRSSSMPCSTPSHGRC